MSAPDVDLIATISGFVVVPDLDPENPHVFTAPAQVLELVGQIEGGGDMFIQLTGTDGQTFLAPGIHPNDAIGDSRYGVLCAGHCQTLIWHNKPAERVLCEECDIRMNGGDEIYAENREYSDREY